MKLSATTAVDQVEHTSTAPHNKVGSTYPPELEIKETTETSASASYLDLLLSVTDGTFSTKLYDKRDNFDFRIVNFPFICSNIPESSLWCLYITTYKIRQSLLFVL